MRVDQDTCDWIFDNRQIAIHHPSDRFGQIGPQDNRSIHPDDYVGKSKRAIQALSNLGQQGGYVCAEYRNHQEILVGVVDPGTHDSPPYHRRFLTPIMADD